jgi:hypothetical protein
VNDDVRRHAVRRRDLRDDEPVPIGVEVGSAVLLVGLEQRLGLETELGLRKRRDRRGIGGL